MAKWAFWRKESNKYLLFPRISKKLKMCWLLEKKCYDYENQGEKIKYCSKSFVSKVFRKKIFFMSKKKNLNFFLLKFYPFLASQEFYHKSILKPRFEAGEAEGSRVERPKKIGNGIFGFFQGKILIFSIRYI